MKRIFTGGVSVDLVRHAVSPDKAGKQPYEAGEDSQGRLYFKGKTGRWSRAYQTETRARQLLDAYAVK